MILNTSTLKIICQHYIATLCGGRTTVTFNLAQESRIMVAKNLYSTYIAFLLVCFGV